MSKTAIGSLRSYLFGLYLAFLPPFILFVLTFAMRFFLHSGFLMGDDPNVIAVTDTMLSHLQMHIDQVYLRFGIWLFHYLSCLAFGVTEQSLFLPLWIVSASFSTAAYWLLKLHGYSVYEAFFGGLVVACSPFEMLIGTSFANDPYLSVAMAYAYVAWAYRERSPRLAGASMAILLWFGFYNKAWVIYLFPLIGLQCLVDYYRNHKAIFWLTFIVLSALLHIAMCGVFWLTLANPVPWLYNLPAHYPVHPSNLANVLLTYPRHLFIGYEYIGNTLFGMVPYLCLLALPMWLLLRLRGKVPFSRFGFEVGLIWIWFFLLINFVPNYFTLEAYHSAPRIFRYLHPISFFLSLHTAKLLLDLWKYYFSWVKPLPKFVVSTVLLLGLFYQGLLATEPGRTERRQINQLVEIFEDECPSTMLMETWPAGFFKRLYLQHGCPDTKVPTVFANVNAPEKVTEWLVEHQQEFDEKTVMVTGLGSQVYYSCSTCFISEDVFSAEIKDDWELVKELGTLYYHQLKPTVKLWQYRPKPKEEPVEAQEPPAVLEQELPADSNS